MSDYNGDHVFSRCHFIKLAYPSSADVVFLPVANIASIHYRDSLDRTAGSIVDLKYEICAQGRMRRTIEVEESPWEIAELIDD